MLLESLDRSCRAAQSAADLLRLSMDASAGQALVDIVDGMTELLRDLQADLAEPIGSVLAELVFAQERGDNLRVADLVEFALLPRLREVRRSL